MILPGNSGKKMIFVSALIKNKVVFFLHSGDRKLNGGNVESGKAYGSMIIAVLFSLVFILRFWLKIEIS